eukprot:scaffold7954_cov97-Isochrysis_galbana.AAC.3
MRSFQTNTGHLAPPVAASSSQHETGCPAVVPPPRPALAHPAPFHAAVGWRCGLVGGWRGRPGGVRWLGRAHSAKARTSGGRRGAGSRGSGGKCPASVGGCPGSGEACRESRLCRAAVGKATRAPVV